MMKKVVIGPGNTKALHLLEELDRRKDAIRKKLEVRAELLIKATSKKEKKSDT
jgi:hypothetical protein